MLHLSDRLTDRGGAHRHMLALARGLLDLGHDAALAVGSVDGSAAAPCSLQLEPALAARRRTHAPASRSEGCPTRAAAGLDALCSDFEPDVVHLHTIVDPAVLEWAAARPALITVQDHRYFCPGRGKWTLDGRVCVEPMGEEPCRTCFEDTAYFRDVFDVTHERLAALRRLRIVALSRYMRDELERAGVPARNVEVIPPFVDGLDPAGAPEGPPCVAFVGRLTEHKGALDAVRAWRLSGVGLPLVVAGTGPLREAMSRAGAEVLGWLDRARLSALLRRARALLLPSRWQEPFGIAGLEALSFGVPVVAYDSGGVREWHPGRWLVPWGDVSAMAGALRPAVRERAEPAPGFTRDVLMSRLLETYKTVAGRTPAGGLPERREPGPSSRLLSGRRREGNSETQSARVRLAGAQDSDGRRAVKLVR